MRVPHISWRRTCVSGFPSWRWKTIRTDVWDGKRDTDTDDSFATPADNEESALKPHDRKERLSGSWLRLAHPTSCLLQKSLQDGMSEGIWVNDL